MPVIKKPSLDGFFIAPVLSVYFGNVLARVETIFFLA